jgi:transposase
VGRNPAIADKIGGSPETLRLWLRRTGHDAGQRPGLKIDEREQVPALERETRELKRANELLRRATASVAAAELDRYTR